MLRGVGAPRVSVIIPVLDDQERLDRCLAALANQTYPADRFEVIVVDNGSRRRARVDAARARVVVELRPGSYAARNAGIAAARGEIFAFTDADCIPAHDWLERGVARLEAEGSGIVAGAVVLFCRDDAEPTSAEIYDVLKGFAQQRFVEQDRFGATANLFTTRTVVERVGGFDASLLSAGDVDFGERVHGAGYRLTYAGDVCVRHPARASMAQLLRKVVRTEVGLKQLAAARGRCHPGAGAYPLALRLLAIPVLLALAPSSVPPRTRVKAGAAMLAVALVQGATRALVDRGVAIDLRRFWGV
jgi:glycosyltransferase involved in cell wall biosynthesis